jgi:hypothetical protein
LASQISLILCGIRKSCHSSRRNLLLYLFIKTATDHSIFERISLLPTTYKYLSNIFLSKLTQYTDETDGNHQCAFQSKSSTTDQIFFHQILDKKWEHNGTV